MKRIVLYVIAIFIFNSNLLAQAIDSAYLKVTYNLVYLIDSTKPERKQKDILHLLIGNKASSFYSYTKFKRDSIVNVHIANGSMEQFIKNPSERDKFGQPGLYSNSTIFLNYPENKLTVVDAIVSKTFIYEEQLEEINWNILSDTMSISGYACQKATTRFRGRNYIAWFSQDVPVNAGPYKFRGLPGLILRLSDTGNNYNFECAGIEQLKEKEAITIQSENCIKTTRNEFRKGFKAMFDSPWESMSGTGITIGGKDGELVKSILLRKLPYNPIELD